jgi:Domain of unknown function (DUF4417)
MSNSHKRPLDRTGGLNDSNTLWHSSGNHSLCLGCQDCFFRPACGGLEVQAALYDCTDFCRCEDPSVCDNVCPNQSAAFAARLQEVRGFKLDNVPNTPRAPIPTLPLVIPMIYHGSRRDAPLRADTVALPLARLVDYARGTIRFPSREALLKAFKLQAGCQILLSGTDRDRDLENWWRLKDRKAVIQGLIELGVALITTPNYSLFGNVPRTDNLYNVKRIALTWSEMQSEGLPCALHVNARTNRDWERWQEFLKIHPEIEVVAFEFGTGAGYEQRILWHVDQLRNLALQVGRPMHLIMRGGVHVFPRLATAFSAITLIDTRPFVKAYRRQRGSLVDGRLRWKKAPTQPGAPIDHLLEDNINAVTAALVPTERIPITATAILRNYKTLQVANDTRHEPLQLRLLDQSPGGQRGPGPIDGQGVIATAESELAAEICQSDE